MSQRYIVSLLRHIAIQTVAPSRDTIFVSRLTSSQAMRGRAPLAPVRRPTVLQRCILRMAGRIVALLCAPARTHSAVSWPGAPAVSQYNVLYRDQDREMGSSPPSCQQPFFFPFFFSSYCKTTKNYFFFPHVFSRTK